MIDKLGNEKVKLLILGLGLMIILAAYPLMAAGQGLGIDTSGPDSAYCTGNGFLYTTTQGVNNGKAVCQFPDRTWCDAHAYFTGNCSPNSSVVNAYNPYAFNTAQGALEIASASKMCQDYGGVVRTVHTVYGDVGMCVFPGGNSVDLRELYSSAFGGYGPGYDSYYLSPYYVGNMDDYSWYYGAYAWLNAP